VVDVIKQLAERNGGDVKEVRKWRSKKRVVERKRKSSRSLD
jgi:hypothetical protein